MHPLAKAERTLMSNAIISKANIKKFEIDFLTQVRTVAESDEDWIGLRKELEKLRDDGKEFPKHWNLDDGLLYYKNRLYVPNNEALLTTIAKGCHDSQVAGHFGQEKTNEIVVRDFYWKGITEWINDYVR